MGEVIYFTPKPHKYITLLVGMDGPVEQTSWTDQFFYLKLWPVCIFEDFPFSLYIVAAAESDEGLVKKKITNQFFLVRCFSKIYFLVQLI